MTLKILQDFDLRPFKCCECGKPSDLVIAFGDEDAPRRFVCLACLRFASLVMETVRKCDKPTT